jgi:tetratricopeptide (TPR) repeat protein
MNPDGALGNRTERDWLEVVRSAVLRGNLAAAEESITRARAAYPQSNELRRTQAGIHQQAGRTAEAEALLRELLEQDPGDAGAAFALARMLNEQGRMAAAASTMRACFAVEENCRDPDLAISAIELLDNCDRKADAAAIAHAAIVQNPDDIRLYAYASMLQMQLGEFEQARQHYLFALQHDERSWEWHMPIGLSSAQRYANVEHPDFALFRAGLQRKTLSEKARAELHFALGKAYDDIGDYGEAARHLREGNAIVHRLTKWSRKEWRRSVEARLAGQPIRHRVEPTLNFVPVFIVGMPRSGTTLLSELLSRYPRVCNRGELPWIADLADRPELSGDIEPKALQRAAAFYTAQSRQDDDRDAQWFLDKQPLNFRYIDLMLAMFPHAKIIHCQRGGRDIALSLWKQCFTKDVQRYAYDFDDIALVLRDCERLMSHWRGRFPESVRTVRYEDLVSDPSSTMATLAQWIGLPGLPPDGGSDGQRLPSQISTASLWQARQPVNTRSIGRWKRYAAHVPELERIAPT